MCFVYDNESFMMPSIYPLKHYTQNIEVLQRESNKLLLDFIDADRWRSSSVHHCLIRYEEKKRELNQWFNEMIENERKRWDAFLPLVIRDER